VTDEIYEHDDDLSSDDEGGDAEVPLLTTRLPTSTYRHKTNEKAQRTRENIKKIYRVFRTCCAWLWRKVITNSSVVVALATVAMAITTGIYTIYSQKQWHSMQDSLRISVRPFVGVDEGADALQTGPVHIDEAGNASVVYRIRAKNYSNSPANNVTTMANFIVADDLNTVYQQEEYACGDAVIGKPDIGLILFPGKERFFTSMDATTTISSKHPGSRLQAWLAGCIGYRDQFGYLYRTKFMYMLYDDAGRVVVFDRPTQPIDIRGHFVMTGGSIDAGQIPKY